MKGFFLFYSLVVLVVIIASSFGMWVWNDAAREFFHARKITFCEATVAVNLLLWAGVACGAIESRITKG